MSDLFFDDTELRNLEIPDGEILYLPALALPADDSALLNHFITEVPWRQEHVFVWGKRHLQPRLVAWYGDKDRSYTYSGIHLTPLPWTSLLLQLKASVESFSGAKFNSVLLNYYRNQQDSMGFHSDDEPELGSESGDRLCQPRGTKSVHYEAQDSKGYPTHSSPTKARKPADHERCDSTLLEARDRQGNQAMRAENQPYLSPDKVATGEVGADCVRSGSKPGAPGFMVIQHPLPTALSGVRARRNLWNVGATV